MVLSSRWPEEKGQTCSAQCKIDTQCLILTLAFVALCKNAAFPLQRIKKYSGLRDTQGYQADLAQCTVDDLLYLDQGYSDDLCYCSVGHEKYCSVRSTLDCVVNMLTGVKAVFQFSLLSCNHRWPPPAGVGGYVLSRRCRTYTLVCRQFGAFMCNFLAERRRSRGLSSMLVQLTLVWCVWALRCPYASIRVSVPLHLFKVETYVCAESVIFSNLAKPRIRQSFHFSL